MGSAGERRPYAASTNTDLPPSFLGRRSSTAIPAKLSLPTVPTTKPLHTFTFHNGSSAATGGSVKPSSPPYTSLRDLLPAGAAAINSPTAVSSCYEISIRNRLVKQAAWAYLQPMSCSPGTSGRGLLHRLWLRFRFCAPVNACVCFVKRHVINSIAAAIDRMLCAVLVRSTR